MWEIFLERNFNRRYGSMRFNRGRIRIKNHDTRAEYYCIIDDRFRRCLNHQQHIVFRGDVIEEQLAFVIASGTFRVFLLNSANTGPSSYDSSYGVVIEFRIHFDLFERMIDDFLHVRLQGDGLVREV